MTANPKHDAVTADLPCHEYGYAADVDKAEASDAISAKNAEITRLREQLAEAQNQLDSALHTNAAWEKRAEEFARQRDVARAEALEEAADVCASIRQRIANGPMPEGSRFDYEQAIRALIKEGRT